MPGEGKDWRAAYGALDAGDCAQEAWRWIEAESCQAKEYVHPMRLCIDQNGPSVILYLDLQPYAVATVLRTAFNRSILIRWKAP